MADIKAEYLACPIRHVVSRFGDKWSMLVLYMLYKSETGVLRFNEIRKLMSDCSQKMLSQTLKNLEQSHLVHREVYPGPTVLLLMDGKEVYRASQFIDLEELKYNINRYIELLAQ